ncbi:MAG: 3-methyl-2-oxobutanoate hydroxymethyltransferase [Spirochaetaceae bacterium]|nr:3-methyl-2-oxobutanoate hydroxymethyltransferase [Spirochaetaceae bacterium]MCF7949639.1 3-methyl-2-oxobutanoate hydroxymethyltransferase [Spirochaetia bacterium]MCF7951844.1 3-methyl-2-oxobutanoate hydroxymethyltransferase [Spirochaetaceae bacterium]
MAPNEVIDKQKWIDKKADGKRITMLTAYDAAFTSLLSQVDGLDMILVGDSLGMVIQGHDTTRAVSMDAMLYHTEIVARSGRGIPVIGDMPYHSFDTADEALMNATRLMEAGASAVKIEGNKPEVVIRLVEDGIPVMGHLGLLPQTAENFKVQGKDNEAADTIFKDALELEAQGAFAVVLECVPRSLAQKITGALKIPSIGIGAGPDCDGQVLVLHDMLGLTQGYSPKFVKRFAQLDSAVIEAVQSYSDEVKSGSFPTDPYSYH